MYIVIAGDPVSGFTYFGPFKDADEALEYVESDSTTEMWATKLIRPGEGECLTCYPTTAPR